jgi:hypothetical protein
MAKRSGRGKLSSIELLPEVCDEHIAWANVELNERRMPQTEILREFNARIADHGCKPISKGAFSRYSVRKAIELRKALASQQITNTIIGQFNLNDRSSTTIATVELLKNRIVELVMGAEDPKQLDIDYVSKSLNRLSTIARREQQTLAAERKDEREEIQRREAEESRKREDAVRTVEKIATEAGLGADRIEAIRKGVLGLAT